MAKFFTKTIPAKKRKLQGDGPQPAIQMTVKIVKVQVVALTGRWGGYKVREITERGAVKNSYKFQYRDEAKRAAKSSAQAHGAELVIN